MSLFSFLYTLFSSLLFFLGSFVVCIQSISIHIIKCVAVQNVIALYIFAFTQLLFIYLVSNSFVFIFVANMRFIYGLILCDFRLLEWQFAATMFENCLSGANTAKIITFIFIAFLSFVRSFSFCSLFLVFYWTAMNQWLVRFTHFICVDSNLSNIHFASMAEKKKMCLSFVCVGHEII